MPASHPYPCPPHLLGLRLHQLRALRLQPLQLCVRLLCELQQLLLCLQGPPLGQVCLLNLPPVRICGAAEAEFAEEGMRRAQQG